VGPVGVVELNRLGLLPFGVEGIHLLFDPLTTLWTLVTTVVWLSHFPGSPVLGYHLNFDLIVFPFGLKP